MLEKCGNGITKLKGILCGNGHQNKTKTGCIVRLRQRTTTWQNFTVAQRGITSIVNDIGSKISGNDPSYHPKT